MNSQSALPEHVSPNIARFLLLDPVLTAQNNGVDLAGPKDIKGREGHFVKSSKVIKVVGEDFEFLCPHTERIRRG